MLLSLGPNHVVMMPSSEHHMGSLMVDRALPFIETISRCCNERNVFGECGKVVVASDDTNPVARSVDM